MCRGAHIAVCSLIAWTASAGAQLTPIALTGDAAPVGEEAVFASLGGPVLGPGGRVVFFAALGGPAIDGTNDGSLWRWSGGGPVLVLREQTPALGPTVSSTLRSIPRAAFAGETIVHAGLDEMDPRWALVTPVPALPPFAAVVAAESADASTPFVTLGQPTLNGAGSLAFDADGGDAVWTTRGGVFEMLAQAGDVLPGLPPLHEVVHLDPPVQGGDGSLVFHALAADPADTAIVSQGVWIDRGAGPELIVASGQPAPGTADAFLELGAQPAVGDAVVFGARTDGVGESDTGLWVWDDGEITPLAVEGDAAPGTADTFGEPSGVPQIAGPHVAFLTQLDDASGGLANSALYTGVLGSTPTLLVREGDRAARLPDGVEYAMFEGPVLNRRGQVFFLAQLRGAAVSPQSNRVLYGLERTGLLRPIVRTGDVLAVAGSPRTITAISFGGDAIGSGYAPIDDGGNAALRIVFDDDSRGLFLASGGCPIDLTTQGAGSGDPGFGAPDGAVTAADLTYYVNAWVARSPEADLTTTNAPAGGAGFAVPDGSVTTIDLQFYVNLWIGGCA